MWKVQKANFDTHAFARTFTYMNKCMYTYTRTYTHKMGKDKQNITTKLYISASSIKSIIKYMLESTGIHYNHLSFSNNLTVVDVADDIFLISTSSHSWICQVLGPSHTAFIVH